MEPGRTQRALEGLRVVELGSSASVAVAGLVLADNGAEVVAVEPPAGSALRGHPAFRFWARGKRSVVADLARPDGRARLDALLDGADVLLVGLKPAAIERLGLDAARLAASHPRLVQCSVTGFGTRGPFREIPGWDAVINARGGRMWQFDPLLDGERPAYVAVPVASHGAAMLTLQAVLGALRERERTGRGQRLETSLIQALGVYDMMYWFPGAFWENSYTDTPFIPYSVARTADGAWVQFAQNGPRLFAALVRVLGLDPDVVPPVELRGQKPGELQAFRARVQERVLERTWDEWQEIFAGEREVSVERLRLPGEGLDHPQLTSTGDVIEIDGVRQPGPLIRLSETPGAPGRTVPELDEAGDAGWRRAALPSREPGPPLAGGLFEGVTVLEFATWIATPLGTTLMADLGARVIKIEPLTGDPMRGPVGVGMKMVQGKQSIALDLKSPEGLEIVHRLVARADALAHNYRPGVPERLGIDWETLRAVNPRLVYLYGASYGSTGPMSSKPAFHVTAGAISGGARAQAGHDAVPPPDVPLEPPEIARLSRRLEIANEGNPDFNAAVGVAAALALGLYARERTGRGQALETRMMLSNAYTNSKDWVDYPGRAPREIPDARLLGLGALYRLYRSRDDGWVFLAAPSQADLERFCRAAGCEALLDDARFRDADARRANDEALADEIARVIATRDADDWERELTARGVACVRADEGPPARWVYEHPDGERLGWWVQLPGDRSAFGSYRRYGRPVVQDRDAGPLGGAFRSGEHTRALLAEVGYADAEIASLLRRGVVAEPE